MIEIAELDHVLALAQDRLTAGRKDEAADYLDQLIDCFDAVSTWAWPATRRAQRDMLSGEPVNWTGAREEFLLAINSQIVSSLNERAAEKRGSEKGIKQGIVAELRLEA